MADESAAAATGMAAPGGVDKLAQLVLFAEFDIDKGSTLRESFPQALPHYSPEFFADVMLPEGVHNRKEDFTVFFLNRQNAKKKAAPAEGEQAGDQSEEAAATDPLREFMYCLSVVHTIHDANVRRGATVKAVALCSYHKVRSYCSCLRNDSLKYPTLTPAVRIPLTVLLLLPRCA